MIHWVFLILAFVAGIISGFVLCYYILYKCSEAYEQVMRAVREGSKSVIPFQ